MSQQFWVNNYFIDIKRNQISHQQQQTPLAPKALAVLTILAQHAGEVVSHDALMDAVWPDTVVTPNTLQRCIAQLRKAFGDDSKHQAFIKTHAKQGYSLEAAVSWDEQKVTVAAEPAPVVPSPPTQTPTRQVNNLWLLIPMIVLVGIVAWWKFSTPEKHVFTQVNPLTASDEKETKARYSPDGKYLVFHRFQATCEHHIWAKDLTTQQEFRLTKEPGIFGSHSWSQDGTQLTFSEKGSCKRPSAAPACWRINTLDFSSALAQPQSVVTRLDCDEQRNAVARYLPHGKIAMLRETAPHTNKLVVFDPRDNQLHDLYSDNKRYLYSYDYSFVSNLIAITSRDDSNNHYIDVIDLAGDVLSSHPVVRRPQDSSYEFYNIHFHPDGEYLVTDTALGLFKLSFDGRLEQINTLGHRHLFDGNYHPDGRRIVASQLAGDKDSVALSWNNLSMAAGRVIARSNAIDSGARRQPNGDIITFMSMRSGTRQLWQVDGDKITQLSMIDHGYANDSFSWSPDGASVAAVVNDQVSVLSLDGKEQRYETSLAIEFVMAWETENTLIVSAVKNNSSQLYRLRLLPDGESEIIALVIDDVNWAQAINSIDFVVSYNSGEVWLRGQLDKHLAPLDGQVFKQNLRVFDGKIYGLNEARQLWRFDIEANQFEVLSQYTTDVTHLSDVNSEGILVNQVIDFKKELIEFQ